MVLIVYSQLVTINLPQFSHYPISPFLLTHSFLLTLLLTHSFTLTHPFLLNTRSYSFTLTHPFLLTPSFTLTHPFLLTPMGAETWELGNAGTVNLY